MCLPPGTERIPCSPTPGRPILLGALVGECAWLRLQAPLSIRRPGEQLFPAVVGLSWRAEDALSAARQSQGPATPSPTEDQPSFRVSRLCLHHRTENDSFPCFPASLSGKGAFGGWRVWPPPWWIPAAAGPLLVFSLHSCRAGGAWGYGSTRVRWAFHALVGSPAPSPGVGTKQALCP